MNKSSIRDSISKNNLKKELYYAKKDCPNYSQFGTPLLKDENGRYYKLAFSNDNLFTDKNTPKSVIKNGLNGVKFYVKLPKGTSWYQQNELMKPINFYYYDDLNDTKLRLKVESFFTVKNAKTGYVFLNGQDLIKIFIYLFI